MQIDKKQSNLVYTRFRFDIVFIFFVLLNTCWPIRQSKVFVSHYKGWKIILSIQFCSSHSFYYHRCFPCFFFIETDSSYNNNASKMKLINFKWFTFYLILTILIYENMKSISFFWILSFSNLHFQEFLKKRKTLEWNWIEWKIMSSAKQKEYGASRAIDLQHSGK